MAGRRQESVVTRPRLAGSIALLLTLLLFALPALDGLAAGAESAPGYTGSARVLQPADVAGRGTPAFKGAGLLRDPDHRLDIEAISAMPAAAFEPLDGHTLRQGFSSDVFWLRLDLSRTDRTPANLVLVIWPPFINRIDFYRPQGDGSFSLLRAGDHVPVSERAVARAETTLPMLVTTQPQTWFLRVESNSVINLSAQLSDQASFAASSSQRATRQGFFFGMILTAALIAVLAAVWLRQRVFVLAAGYLLCFLGFQFVLNGYDQILIYPEQPWLSDNLIGVFAAMATALMLWFSLSYLEPRHIYPRLNALIHVLATISLIFALVAISGHYALVAPYFLVLVVVAPLAMFALFLFMLSQARERALAMLLMFTPVLAVTLLQALHNTGWLGATNQLSELWGIASLAQMPVAAVAILLRVRETQQALAVEASYRVLVENQVDLVVRLDLWQRLAFVSPSYCKLFGEPREKLVGSAFLDRVHPDDIENAEAALSQVLGPAHTSYLEIRMQTDTGWRWLGWSLTAVRDRSGKITSLTGVGRDITARVEAESALARSQDKLDLALETGGIGFYTVTLADRSIEIDDRYLQILGYQPGQLQLDWSSWQARLHPEDRDRSVRLTEKYLFEAGTPLEIEYRIRHRDGHWIWILDRAEKAEVDESGQLLTMVGLIQDITRRKRTELKLAYLVRHDELTGLLNRRGIAAVARRQRALSNRDGRPCAFAMVDLDHFKRVNDTLGHEAGDEVLRQVGKLLKQSVRDSDWVGRWGGEEFLVVLPLCSLEEAVVSLERVRQAVAARPLRVDQDEVAITISAGVTITRDSERDLDEVIDRADQALYRAKESGRNRVCTDPA
ncbi:MAG: diguanylate cyclase [Wenzhouxiangella sp.]|nr:MAG: diguanylate cyclase [Wenzhouxiangella sp.]